MQQRWYDHRRLQQVYCHWPKKLRMEPLWALRCKDLLSGRVVLSNRMMMTIQQACVVQQSSIKAVVSIRSK